MTMAPDALFSVANSAALLGWLGLALAPLRLQLADRMAVAIALALATLYTALILTHFSGAPGGFDSLDAVARLFTRPHLLLAGWVHYLAFDLLIGTWVRGQARRHGLPYWARLPCLALVFLFGPLGWLVAMGVLRFRAIATASPRV